MPQTRVSVLIATRNESQNLPQCLKALQDWADEVVVVDSQSTDDTVKIAKSFNATVIQFFYNGGLPKKRQWTLDTYNFRNDWILILDADEILSEPIKEEINEAILCNEYNGFWMRFDIFFLGKQLKHGASSLWKLFLFRKGKGRYETILEKQNHSMSDIEVHEHIKVDGRVGKLKCPVRHENYNSLDRYIQKHNEYSNWSAKAYLEGYYFGKDIRMNFFGSQVERRRWFKHKLFANPFYPCLFFIYKYFFRLGFLDGKQGLIYCLFQSIQAFHVKAKIFEYRIAAKYR